MERTGYSYNYRDNVTGGPLPSGRGTERVITETEHERGYSVKCCGCIPLCFDRTRGPLIRNDMAMLGRPTGFLRLLQLVPLIIAFIAIELAFWCFFGLRPYRFFSTVTMSLIWFNVLFLFIYLCQCQWRLRFFDIYILDILYHIVAIILLLISSVYLSIYVCSSGHIVAAVFGFIAALLYILSLVFLIREYQNFRKIRDQERAWKYNNQSTIPSTAGPGSPVSGYYPQHSSTMERDPRVLYGPPYPLPPDYYRNAPPGGVLTGDPGRQVPVQIERPIDYYNNRPVY